MHFYAWKRGLKTGMYYLRSKPSTNAVKVTVGQQSEDEDCLNCGA
jgi:ribonucleoside-diphosphate reductase alpha chain/ribonucleoside-diphosphate reductase subunit M1